MAYQIQGPEGLMVYCANYRTGSTATGATLVGLGGEQLSNHHSPPSEEVLEKKPIVAQTVRHHCDVIASYWYKLGCRKPLELLVEEILDGKDEYFKANAFYDRYPMATYIMRYPALEVELGSLLGLIGLDAPKKLERNKSNRPAGMGWKTLFSHSLRTQVIDRYQHEIEEFGLWQ